jgi:hypothetical protein
LCHRRPGAIWRRVDAYPANRIHRPCLPTKASRPPSGALWLHEIKHDGFRVIARKQGEQVRLYSRPGNDLTARFPLIVEAMACLRSRSGDRWRGRRLRRQRVPRFDRIRYLDRARRRRPATESARLSARPRSPVSLVGSVVSRERPLGRLAQVEDPARAELLRMNSKFSAAMEHAPEAPREAPDRVALPGRLPRAPRGSGTWRRELLPAPKVSEEFKAVIENAPSRP